MPISKKLFFTSLALFCLALILFGAYNLAFKKDAPVQTTDKKAAPSAKDQPDAPKVSNDPIMAISQEPILAPLISNDGSGVKYYAKSNGHVYQTDFTGNGKRTLSDKDLPGLISVEWSSDKNKVLTKFYDGKASYFSFYDYNEQSGTRLNDHITSVAWQSGGSRIFYEFYDPTANKSTLNISDPDGKNWTKLADMAFSNALIAQIPQTGAVSFWNKPDAFFETALNSIPLAGGEPKSLLKGYFGADYLWNGNGSAALVSHSDAKGGTKIQLSIINANGGEFRDLDFPTFASKCVWLRDNKTAYCAWPAKIPPGSILPNDYDQEKFHTADSFWRINTATGEKSRIVDLNNITGEYDASDLFLNNDESILFFRNRTDGKLYRIIL